MNRHFVNVLCQDPSQTALFYQSLLGMTRHYDMDWFVLLTHPDMPGLEFGLLQIDHDSVPAAHRSGPAGIILTFVVEDVDSVHEAAQATGVEIVTPPTDMPYGQRRLLLRDPAGALVDVSAPVPA